jgi:hypothetical protein
MHLSALREEVKGRLEVGSRPCLNPFTVFSAQREGSECHPSAFPVNHAEIAKGLSSFLRRCVKSVSTSRVWLADSSEKAAWERIAVSL